MATRYGDVEKENNDNVIKVVMRCNPEIHRLRSLLPRVRKRLRPLPGVLGLGIGYKEKNGRATRTLAWRVYVVEKLPRPSIPRSQHIPKTLFGIPTDVIPQLITLPAAYGNSYVDELRPGVRIGGMSSGTLGCFARKKSNPAKIVILSNSHVIFSDMVSLLVKTDVDIGQPKVRCSWCCKCRVVGEALYDDHFLKIGTEILTRCFNSVEMAVSGVPPKYATQRGSEIDCAMAEINFKRAYTNKIEGVGMIKGTPAAGNLGVTAGAAVKKIGSATGLTTGTMASFKESIKATYISGGSGPLSELQFPLNPEEETSVEDDFAGAVGNINQFLVIPDAPDADSQNSSAKTHFVQPGDSGSVVVNSSRQVIGLINRGWIVSDDNRPFFDNVLATPLPAHAGTLGVVNPIHPVLKSLDIEIVDNMSGTVTSGTATSSATMISVPSNEILDLQAQERELARTVEALEKEVKSSPLGEVVYNKIEEHRDEVLRMVNAKRPVMVAWQRNKGPAFVAHILKSVMDKSYEIPQEVNGITRAMLLRRMADVLKAHGSEALKTDIEQADPLIVDRIVELKSVWDLLPLLWSGEAILEEAGLSVAEILEG